MNFNFQKSKHPTIGVEIEIQILDSNTLDLIPQSEKLLKLCQENNLERVKTEVHQSMLEVDSEISLNVKECKKYLKSRLIQLNELAEHSGLRLGLTGTHPFQHWKDRLISKQDRYEFLHEKFQWLIRRMNVYGLHVHVGMTSKDKALAVSRGMIQYLPHLLALSSNSPFWQGIDTGMQCSRVSVIESFPYAGLPLPFNKWKEFEHYYNTLHQVGVIGSLKDLYWHIRPNLSFGTIEFRMCDVMITLSETMALVALIHCLVARIYRQIDEQPSQKLLTQESYWIAPHNQWIAARDGLQGEIVIDLEGRRQMISEGVLDLIEQLSSIAKDLNCLEELQDLKKILSHGNGAQKQRSIYAKTESLREVVAVANREFKKDLQIKRSLF